jgi:predicted DNA binding CopG/RHH family protein
MKKESTTLAVNTEISKKVKIIAIQKGINYRELTDQILADYVKKHEGDN